MTAAWPDVLVPRSVVGPELRNSARSGGPSLSGAEQRVFSSAGRWEIKYEGFPVNTRAQVLAWRAMADRLRAGEDILLKVFDRNRADGADGAEPLAHAVGAAAAGTTTLQVEASGLDLEPGIHFSIGQRLYRIKEITAVTSSDSLLDIILSESKTWSDAALWVEDGTGGSVYTVNFLPPLRAAAAALSTLDFVNLVCLCTPVDLNDGDLSLDMGRFGTPSITFREA